METVEREAIQDSTWDSKPNWVMHAIATCKARGVSLEDVISISIIDQRICVEVDDTVVLDNAFGDRVLTVNHGSFVSRFVIAGEVKFYHHA